MLFYRIPLDLFKNQVMVHIVPHRYGQIIFSRPINFTVLTAIFSAIALALVLFLVLFSYTRKERVSGTLQPEQGLIRVLPQRAGVIIQIPVQEGQQVEVDDILFALSNERFSAAHGETEQAINTLLQARRDALRAEQKLLYRQSEQRIAALKRKMADLADEVHRFKEQESLQQQRIALGEAAVDRYRQLHASSFISAAGLQDKQAELIDQQARLAELRRMRDAAERAQADIQADLNDLRTQAERDQSAARRDVASIEQDLAESAARREILIRAPHAGTISAITVEAGQAVAANQPLATLIPQNTLLEAELYIPSRAIGFIKPGMHVRLRYQAYPYQKFGQFNGTVREVSGSALRPEDLSLPGADPVYRARVTLEHQNVTAYGTAQPLKVGMTLEASILLETRKLYEWVLEPLFSIRGRR